MSQYSNTMTLTGTVFNPYAIKYTDGSLNGVNATYGTGGEQIVSMTRGKYATANIRGAVFTANVAAVTLPISTTAGQLFALVNPVGSGVNVELIRSDFLYVVATTTTDALGLYFANASQTALWSSLTAGTVLNGQCAGPSGKAIFYTAATKSGTNTLQALLGGWGATTNTGLGLVRYDFDGTTIIPPGIGVMISMSTTVATASGITGSLTWLEYNA